MALLILAEKPKLLQSILLNHIFLEIILLFKCKVIQFRILSGQICLHPSKFVFMAVIKIIIICLIYMYIFQYLYIFRHRILPNNGTTFLIKKDSYTEDKLQIMGIQACNQIMVSDIPKERCVDVTIQYKVIQV